MIFLRTDIFVSSVLLSTRLVKRSQALRGRNLTRNSQVQGASRTRCCPGSSSGQGSPLSIPSNALAIPQKIRRCKPPQKPPNLSGSTCLSCDRAESWSRRSRIQQSPIRAVRPRAVANGPVASRRTLYSSPGRSPNQAGGTDSRSRHDPRRVGRLRMRARRM